MTPQTFIKNFDLFAEAPGGVPKLRELILQLAVRGQLVPQDAGAGKAKIHHEGHEERQGVDEEAKIERPYVIPPGWRWIALGNAVDYNYGKKTDSRKIPANAWLLDLEDVDKDTSRVLRRVLAGDRPSTSTKSRFSTGDVLYGKLRPYLNKVLVADSDGYCTTEIVPMKPSSGVDSFYAISVLKSRDFLDYTAARSYGMKMPRLGTEDAKRAPFPLPPLAEQKRIVARVDELMKRCDELEARQNERNERRTVLTASCLHAVTSTPRKTAAPEIRRALENFSLLIDTPESVTDLRKTILQLAVQGRLVPQDPRDEPASVLLKRLETATPSTVDGRPLRQRHELPAVDESRLPFEVPADWQWVRFGHVACISSNLVRPEGFCKLPHVAPNNIEKDSGRLLECVTVGEDDVRSGNHRFFKGQILYSKIRPNLNKVAIAPFEGLCSADMYPIDSLIWPAYLARYMLSSVFLSMSVREDTRVAMPKINQEQLNLILVAVPPLAEQKRIVAKVNELMALCDALETKLTQSREDADTFAAAVVHHLCNGGSRPKEVTA